MGSSISLGTSGLGRSDVDGICSDVDGVCSTVLSALAFFIEFTNDIMTVSFDSLLGAFLTFCGFSGASKCDSSRTTTSIPPTKSETKL